MTFGGRRPSPAADRGSGAAMAHAAVRTALALAFGLVHGCAPAEEGSRLAVVSEHLTATRHLQPYHLPVATLTDQSGQPFELRAEAAGKVTVLYFGYTQCPDVCPITMSRVARALSLLDEDTRAGVLPVFITLDPARDPPEQIARWLGALDPSIVGLTGTQEAVDDAVGQLGFVLPPLQRPASGWYEVAHPAALFLFTPELLGRYGYPHGDPTPEQLAEDLRTLVAFDW